MTASLTNIPKNGNYSTKTWVIGTSSHYLPHCQSTNDLAAEKAREACPEGLVVHTDHQTAGRGQRGTQWQAAPGENLTLSIVLRPTFLAPREQFKLSVSMALGVRDALQDCLPNHQVHIKWPNDILIDLKKAAGLLIENNLSGGKIAWSIIGIGVNVNQQHFDEVAAFAFPPVSLAQCAGGPLALEAVMQKLLEHLDARYLRLRAGHYPSLLQDYYQHLLGYQQECRWLIVADDREVWGTVKGVDENGRLKLLIDQDLCHFDLKELRLLSV